MSMDVLEGIDWEAIGEYIEPVIGLVVALLFMGFVRLMKSSRRRQETPSSATMPPVRAPRLKSPKLKYSVGADPIEPGDDAAKLSKRFSQSPSKRTRGPGQGVWKVQAEVLPDSNPSANKTSPG